MKKDVYQIITDRVIQLLEAGTVPWHRPWKGGMAAARNLMSRKEYRGINYFLLNSAGFPSPYWLTFKQAEALGGQIKKGAKSFPVVFWKILEAEEGGETRKIPLLRHHSVFNIAQCEGITMPASLTAEETFQPIKKCEEVVARMPQPPAIVPGTRAAYSPVTDVVSIPEAGLFESPEAYYSMLFHELTHATGHSSRLNRDEVAAPSGFGSEPYSREELVAEMGAAFLSRHCGIEQATLNQSASYIGHWLQRLQDDRRLVVQAAAQAQKACDFILEARAEDEALVQYQPKECEAMALRESAIPWEIQQCDPPSRRLKIEASGDFWKGAIKPKIRLIGRWLERAGFRPGNRVSVTCVASGVIELRSSDANVVDGIKPSSNQPDCPF